MKIIAVDPKAPGLQAEISAIPRLEDGEFDLLANLLRPCPLGRPLNSGSAKCSLQNDAFVSRSLKGLYFILLLFYLFLFYFFIFYF